METRRDLLKACTVGVLTGLAGCMEPKSRQLRTGSVRTNRTGDKYLVEVEIDAGSNGGSREWQTFHNVTVRGISGNNKALCQTDVADSLYRTSETVTLECARLPTKISLQAAESQCERNTEIINARYDRREDGQPIYETVSKQCQN